MVGNNKDEIIKLWNKTKTFAEQLHTGVINKYNAWYAITATIMKTLEYPMLATTITEASWDFIMSPIRKSGLPKQVSSNFPGKVLYEPRKIQGMGIMVHPFYLLLTRDDTPSAVPLRRRQCDHHWGTHACVHGTNATQTGNSPSPTTV
jgi:hypothetical protein